MRSVRGLAGCAAALLAMACVTINVYFPAAAAEEAAGRFIDDVIGEESEAEGAGNGARETETDEGVGSAIESAGASARSVAAGALAWVVPAAHAQDKADIDVNTPQIRRIKQRMEQRYSQSLKQYFDSGAIGLTVDALVAVRDLSQVSLSDRNRLKQLVTEENKDRNAVYREIAVANGHPEWEDRIREIFAEQWINKAKSGWYYQRDNGSWTQK